MIFAACLDGLGTVNLLQHHDSRQMVGEGHGAHGELEICPVLDTLCHTEGRTDQETCAAFAGYLYILQLVCEGLTGKHLAFRSEDAKPCTLGNLRKDQLRFLFQTCGDFSRGGIIRQTVLGAIQ